MTQFEIDILLHCYASAFPHPKSYTHKGKLVLRQFAMEGLLIPGPNWVYTITLKGERALTELGFVIPNVFKCTA